MNIETLLSENVIKIVNELYNLNLLNTAVQITSTRKDFQGDYTIVIYPLLQYSKKTPQETGEELGKLLEKKINFISDFQVVKGYLNVSINQNIWLNILQDILKLQANPIEIKSDKDKKKIVIEFSSPNTNKPLHLGHIRNNLLGYSLYRILKFVGNDVKRVNLVNDRGIHICKTMLAWEKWGNNVTPEDANIKGDHFVGDYYVMFEKMLKKDIEQIMKEDNLTAKEALQESVLMNDAQRMLRKWERSSKPVIQLWKKMNKWVLDGFEVTYKNLGIKFDKTYFESETYLIGKNKALEELKRGNLKFKENDSVYIDLKAEGLEDKIILRSDGTTVYMTQDIGTAISRYEDYKFDKHIYVVGNEQDYHFKVLKIILERFGYKWGKNLEHFSYGMVELPDGKMKSREGKVVDADNLIEEMLNTAKQKTEELGKITKLDATEKEKINKTIALGALKYFILKIEPKRNMIFNPEESIDFNGNTGPFIQYTYARIQSLFRNAEEQNIEITEKISSEISINDKELELIKAVNNFETIVKEAAKKYSPAIIANYVYELTKAYNSFYHDFSILKADEDYIRNFRLLLSKTVGKTIKEALYLLGIDVPSRM